MFKYRGKMVGFFGGWFEYGSHVHEFYKVSHDDGTFESTTYDRHFIVTKEGEKHQVDPSTLGVSWGMKDKDVDVFTGDILKDCSGYKGVVFFSVERNGFCLKVGDSLLSFHRKKHAKKLGNIHDNPEIIEEEGMLISGPSVAP